MYTLGFLSSTLDSVKIAGICVCVDCSVMSNSLQPHGLYLTRLLCPWDSPGQNTGWGCHLLLQAIFLTWGMSPALLPCRKFLYHLSYNKSNREDLSLLFHASVVCVCVCVVFSFACIAQCAGSQFHD